ncbi:outer membrane protein assembly factor BamB [Roseateles violae]|uniref:Outer membrane protein assembly factor BamB n=1 Tax=Roseateles violae TaxID=3058042 RepID=A0ABT8DZJ7_9BURK|nr:outer membrane protein assembly factor BamB [Pelomonas sp. PFR6]MDN3923027.1 outer membrane protein assembly factor BamB [Pelomonas sp. PFR6]
MPNKIFSIKLAAALTLASLLSACSLFGSSNAPKPTPLEADVSAGKARVLWNARVDGLQTPLSFVARGEQFIVAGNDGVVQALRAADGQSLWRAEVGGKLSAGVGSDGRFAAVVTRSNELVVIDAGQVLWRKTMPTPVNTAPLVAGERVFVLTVDRQVQAFDALDGRKLWEMRRPGDALTLAQAGVIGVYKDTLIVGQGPRMAGVDPLRGTVRWEASVANPRGTNEVERLADLIGPLVRQGEMLCARGFQSAVGCVSGERGNTIWSRNVGGTRGIGGDAQYIYGADGSDRLTAWKIGNGDTFWTAEQFQNRKLSSPAAVGEFVLVGDFEGYVHLVARDSGKTVARLATDGSAIVAAPLVLNGVALVATRNGGLYAIKPE